MKRSMFTTFRRLLLVAAGVAMISCAQEAEEADGATRTADAPNEVSALPPDALVATVTLSPTHSISFYDIGGGGGVYTEVYNVDSDVSATESLPKNEQLATVYTKLAGAGVDPAALKRLVEMDEERTAKLELAAPDEPEEPGVGRAAGDFVPATTASGDKGWNDDLAWFSGNYCGGCLGQEGSRRGWEPAQFPTCTTSPDVCEAASKEQVYNKSARNFTAFAFNVSSSGNGEYTSYLRDPCQYDSWWSQKFTVCKKGAQLAYVQIAPRQVIRSITTAGESWKYGVKVTGPANVALSLDFY